MKILFMFLFSTLLLAAENGDLETFKVPTSNVKIAKTLFIDSPFAKTNEKLFADEFTKGPNFANHYRIVRMDCGKGCARIAVIDMGKGKFFETPLAIDGTADWIRNDILQFKAESKLLVMTGCLVDDKKKCGVHEYSWNDDDKFKLEFFRSIN